MLRRRLPDGSRESSLWDGWLESLVILWDFLIHCDGSPVLPATAGQWVWLGDSSSELYTPLLPSIKLRLCWDGGHPGPARVWSLLILDFVITLNLVLSDALTNDTSDRNCV